MRKLLVFLLGALLCWPAYAQQVPNPVSGPATSTVSTIACWNNSTGRELKDCKDASKIITDYPSVYNPALPTNALKVEVGGDPGINHPYIRDIANGVFSNVLIPPTSTTSVAAAFSGWTSGSSTYSENAGLVLFGGSFSKANGNNPYGATLTVCNCPGFAAGPNAGFDFTYMVGFEADVQVLNKSGGAAPAGQLFAFLAQSFNQTLPTGPSYGFIARHDGIGPYGFQYAFYSEDGAGRDAALHIGSKEKTGDNSPSQEILFKARTAGIGGHLGGLTYQEGGNLVFTPGTVAGAFTTTGHYAASGPAVTVSACGAAPNAYTSNDTRGFITVGSGTVTECTVTFGVQYGQQPVCVVTSASGTFNAGILQMNDQFLKVGFSANAAGSGFSYFCIQ